MLMESVSDPRRANWLTIMSMSDDLCWPDEPTASRPNWELEAEILRLTTRLMMRERELRQAKSQLKAQASKAQQQASSWRRRMEEKEEQMRELLLQKDAEMQNIVSQLLLFEAELRREQSRIEDLLSEKDAQIQSQKKEIVRLKNYDAKISTHTEDSGVVISSSDSCPSPLDCSDMRDDLDKPFPVFEDTPSPYDSRLAVQKLKDGLVKIRAIQDVTNVKGLDSHPDGHRTRIQDSTLSYDWVLAEKKRVPYRAPQKMKDLKAKRSVNPHKIHRPAVCEMNNQVIL